MEREGQLLCLMATERENDGMKATQIKAEGLESRVARLWRRRGRGEEERAAPVPSRPPGVSGNVRACWRWNGNGCRGRDWLTPRKARRPRGWSWPGGRSGGKVTARARWGDGRVERQRRGDGGTEENNETGRGGWRCWKWMKLVVEGGRAVKPLTLALSHCRPHTLQPMSNTRCSFGHFEPATATRHQWSTGVVFLELLSGPLQATFPLILELNLEFKIPLKSAKKILVAIVG